MSIEQLDIQYKDPSNPRGLESRVEPVVVTMLEDMTDAVLRAAGYQDGQTTPVATFRVNLPASIHPGYDLRIHSIAAGVGGFNTATGKPLEGDDNSRRWAVYIDRGTTFGSAYDNKGTVYAHGVYQASGLIENVATGSITELIHTFHDNHEGDIEFEL